MPDLVQILSSVRFAFDDEDGLQRGIVALLEREEIPFEREVRVSESDRVDFLVAGTAVEVKVAGSQIDLLRQIHRYAHNPRIEEVIVLTTRQSHRAMPERINDKPVNVIWIGGQNL